MKTRRLMAVTMDFSFFIKFQGGTDHSDQCFLITPKLLPGLTDMEHEDVTILC